MSAKITMKLKFYLAPLLFGIVANAVPVLLDLSWAYHAPDGMPQRPMGFVLELALISIAASIVGIAVAIAGYIYAHRAHDVRGKVIAGLGLILSCMLVVTASIAFNLFARIFNIPLED
jgi:NADH:ubiquinone oxidoreductase subunit 3 (subunit A)